MTRSVRRVDAQGDPALGEVFVELYSFRCCPSLERELCGPPWHCSCDSFASSARVPSTGLLWSRALKEAAPPDPSLFIHSSLPLLSCLHRCPCSCVMIWFRSKSGVDPSLFWARLAVIWIASSPSAARRVVLTRGKGCAEAGKQIAEGLKASGRQLCSWWCLTVSGCKGDVTLGTKERGP